MLKRDLLTRARCWVIKVGTRVCLDNQGRLNGAVLLSLAQQIAELRSQGHSFVIVSSGAVGMGREVLRLEGGQENLPAKQALAAIGQVAMMDAYKRIYSLLHINVAQVLLTWDDLTARDRYLNARHTLLTLLEHGILPVINENDSVATREIKVGDNDNLASLVGGLINADVVVNLTSVPGILTGDCAQVGRFTTYDCPDCQHGSPRRVLDWLDEITPEVRALDQGVTTVGGTGGLTSKLQAAQRTMLYGGAMVIAQAREPQILLKLSAGRQVGTLFAPSEQHLSGRQRWLATGAKPGGSVIVDKGAEKALTQKGSSLLPVGVLKAQGDFEAGEIVNICAQDGREIAKGLCNYSSAEIALIAGHSGEELQALLGHPGYKELVHRNNLVLTGSNLT